MPHQYSDDPTPTIRYGLAVLAHSAGDIDLATVNARRSLADYQDSGDIARAGNMMALLGVITFHGGDTEGALDWYESGLRHATWSAAPRANVTLLANVAPV
jgi:hypothetical protein